MSHWHLEPKIFSWEHFFLVIVPWFDPGNYHSPLPLVGAFDRAVDKEAALL